MAAETFGENTIVIDLGLDRGEPETYARPTRRTVAPWFAPVLIALLVLVVAGGSAAPPAPALSPLLTLRVGPADTYALTDNNELLAQTQGTLAAYDLATGAERWRIDSDRPTYRLRAANGLVLMRPWTSYGPGRPNTTALSLATGLTRWRHDGTVMNLPGSGALLGVYAVRSGGTNRRVQGPVQSLQPVDGTVLWEVDVPGTAVLLGVPAPATPAPG